FDHPVTAAVCLIQGADGVLGVFRIDNAAAMGNQFLIGAPGPWTDCKNDNRHPTDRPEVLWDLHAYAHSGLLEAILQGELNDAGFRGRAGDLAEPGAEVDAGNAEVRVVGRVEELSAELEAVAFGKGKILTEIEVEVDESGSTKDADAGGAEDLIGGKAG